MVSVEIHFTGQSSHAAAAPWAGKSALDAVELMDIAWNFKREHLRVQQRSHYVITHGGDQPNVVPPAASVWYYFRELDYDHIKELWDLRRHDGRRPRAMMTGTSFTSRVLGSAWPQHGNRPIAQAMHLNIQKVGMPQWSEADQQFARAFQRAQGAPERGLTDERSGQAQRTRIHSRQRAARRRVRRHRRHHVERADGRGSASRRTSRARPGITGRARSRWQRRSRTRAPRKPRKWKR